MDVDAADAEAKARFEFARDTGIELHPPGETWENMSERTRRYCRNLQLVVIQRPPRPSLWRRLVSQLWRLA